MIIGNQNKNGRTRVTNMPLVALTLSLMLMPAQVFSFPLGFYTGGELGGGTGASSQGIASGRQVGAVYAETVLTITDSSGQRIPIIVEYGVPTEERDETGNLVDFTGRKEIGPVPGVNGESYRIDHYFMGASIYADYLQQYIDIKTELNVSESSSSDCSGPNPCLLSLEEFLGNGDYYDIDGNIINLDGSLPPLTRSLVIAPQNQRSWPSSSELVLKTFIINFKEPTVGSALGSDFSTVLSLESYNSLLLFDGQVHYASQYNLGYRVGLFGKLSTGDSGFPMQSESYYRNQHSERNEDGSFLPGQEDFIYRPIVGVRVNVDSAGGYQNRGSAQNGAIGRDAEGSYNLYEQCAEFAKVEWDEFESPSISLDEYSRRLCENSSNVFAVTGRHVAVDPDLSGSELDNYLNEAGRFAILYNLPPCPGSWYSNSVMMSVNLKFKIFNPALWSNSSENYSKRSHVYRLQKHGLDTCYGYNGNPSTPILPPRDFQARLMVLSGQAYMSNMGVDNDLSINEIDIAQRGEPDEDRNDSTNRTKYTYAGGTPGKVKQDIYDFDGDLLPDVSCLGALTDEGKAFNEVINLFLPSAGCDTGDVQGIYLSSGDRSPSSTENDQPNFTRLADNEMALKHVLVDQINYHDLRDTDIYVFRESDGSLITQRNGLPYGELPEQICSETDPTNCWQASSNTSQSTDGGNIGGQSELGVNTTRFFYRVVIRGTNELPYYLRNWGGWEEFQVKNKFNEKFNTRMADHLRPGEVVSIIAINRATGYIGRTYTRLQGAGGLDGESGRGEITFDINEIVMRPPNLKVWATRIHETTANTSASIIGNEGSGLANDALIEIHTEWNGYQGLPLPEALGSYGYTARLAVINEVNTLSNASEGLISSDEQSVVHHIPIRPGKNMVVVRLPGGTDPNKHFYFQVAGGYLNNLSQPAGFTDVSRYTRDDGDLFEASGRNSDVAILEDRPDFFVPIKVPVFDELTTRSEQWFTNVARQNNPTADIPDPKPTYRWIYRPEYQFSIFDLEVGEINRQFVDESGQVTTVDIYGEDNPFVNSGDDLIQFVFDLLGSAFQPLARFSGDRELVLALGAQEIEITVGLSGSVQFENLEHLALLDSADLLSLRLYQNNDDANILWEYSLIPPFIFGNTVLVDSTRTESMADFAAAEGQLAAYSKVIDNYQKVSFGLTEKSLVHVELVPAGQGQPQILVSPTTLEPGDYTFAVSFDEIANLVLPRSGIDFYIRISAVSEEYGEESRQEVDVPGVLSNQTSGEILGQVLQHDVLIQRGTLSLRREDLQLAGAGPQLNFIRSYSNEKQVHKSKSALGAGWSHNHDIRLQVIAKGADNASQPNNLPAWWPEVRNGEQPKIMLSAEFRLDDEEAKIIAVSNGGTFQRFGGLWYPQRGNHGSLIFTAGKWEYRSKDGTVYTFGTIDNGVARVDTIVDRNGFKLQYEYKTYNFSIVDRQQYVTKITEYAAVTNTEGRSLEFDYDEALFGEKNIVRLLAVRGPDGIQLDMSYQDVPLADNNIGLDVVMLKTFSRGDFSETYAYEDVTINDAANMKSYTDVLGKITEIRYYPETAATESLRSRIVGLDARNLVHKVVYDDGSDAEFVYDVETDNKRIVYDLENNPTTYTLNAHGNPIQIDSPESHTVNMTWSIDEGLADNVMTSRTDEFNNTTFFEYDAKGNLTLETDPYNKFIVQEWFTEFSVLKSRTDKNGNVYSQEIDLSNGNVTDIYRDATVAGVVTQTHVINQYEPNGLLKKTIDARGKGTEYTYDTNGLLDTVTVEQVVGAGVVTDYNYDTRGRLDNKIDPNEEIWNYSYDDLDRLQVSTDPLGNTVTNDYDAKGNKTNELHSDSYLVDGTTYGRTLNLQYTYTDNRDRVNSIIRTATLQGVPDSTLTGAKTFEYDNNSNLLSESDWKENKTVHTYDALNRRDTTTNRDFDVMSYDYVFVSGAGLKKTTTDYEGRDTVEHYDMLNRLTLVEYEQVNHIDLTNDNYTMSYTYDFMTNVVSTTDRNENITTFVYDARYLKVSQKNADLIDRFWQYDENGNEVYSENEEDQITTTSYDNLNRVTDVYQPENHHLQYGYDDNGNVVSQIDAWGYETTTTYDAVNQPLTITDPDGLSTVRYTHDGILVFRSDAEGRKYSFIYTADNRLVQSIDAVGRETNHTYDVNGNVTDVELTWATSVTGPTSTITNNTFDVLDRLEIRTDGFGSSVATTTVYVYDKVGNLIRETKPDGRVTFFDYDELNRQTLITDVDGNTIQNIYDGVGNLKETTDRRGNSTRTDYDVLNRPTTITDDFDKTLVMTYDDVGNLLTDEDKLMRITTHVYDDLNRLEDSTKAGVRLVYNEYDINGLNSQDRQDAITDAENNRVVSHYNWRGQVTRTDLPVGDGAIYPATYTEALYDNSGFQTTAYDALRNETVMTYFDDGSIQSQRNAELESTTFQYDLYGNAVTVIKPKGASYTTTSIYDALNRLSSVTDALGEVTRFVYDANSNLTHQYTPGATDVPSENHVEYIYNTLNRKTDHIQYKSGGNLTAKFEYDNNGNMDKVTDALDREFTNTYDILNRLNIQTFPVGSDITTIVSTYDSNDNVDLITENKVSGIEVTDHNYDGFDRLTSVAQRSHTVTYDYDDNGNRTLVSSAGGSTTYTYDTRNRLSTAVTAGGTSTYAYFQNNWKNLVQYPNGTEAKYTYDAVGRVDTITNRKTADLTQISFFDYDYDDNGNRTQQIEAQDGFAANQQQTTVYTYDELDRMESYEITDSDTGDTFVTAYGFYPSYDRKSEVITETVSSVETITTNRRHNYDETHWLTSINDLTNAQDILYTYDDNGNTVDKLDNTKAQPEHTLFTYNTRNQLTELSRGEVGSESSQGTYDYNYAGMRIRHLGSERGDIEYIYDDKSVLEEVTNNTSNLVAHYRYADRLISLTTPSDTQYYHFASLGTTANLTDDSGETKVSYRTDPYGEITKQEGDSVNRQVFTGQEHDENTGLIYFGARYYDPDSARFINQDTYLGDPGTPPSLHRYLYAYSNPTLYYDPTGNAPILSDIVRQLDAKAAGINRSALEARTGNGVTGHIVGGMAEVGAGVHSLLSGAVGLVNYAADIAITDGANRLERLGVEFSKYGAVADSKRNVQRGIDGAKKLGSTLAKFGTNKGRGQLGRPLVEWGVAFASGDPKAAQQLTNFSSQLGAGAFGAAEVLGLRTAKSATKPSLTGERVAGPSAGSQQKANTSDSSHSTFYSVQNSNNAERLRGDGSPWPNEPNKSHLGEGVYAWDNKEAAQQYKSLLEKRVDSKELEIVELCIDNCDLSKLKTLDVDSLAGDATEAWMSKHSSLYGEGAPHGYDRVTRKTSVQVEGRAATESENFFSKSIFNLFEVN